MSDMLEPVLPSLIRAALAGALMLVFGWGAAVVLARAAGCDLAAELKAGNVAVGLALMGIFLAVGIGLGLVIGLSSG